VSAVFDFVSAAGGGVRARGGEGFAMASGPPALIAKVGRTCPPFHEDGVARTIEAVLAERS